MMNLAWHITPKQVRLSIPGLQQKYECSPARSEVIVFNPAVVHLDNARAIA